MSDETISPIIQLRLDLVYGEGRLSFVMALDYGLTVSPYGVVSVLYRAKLTILRNCKRRIQRRLDGCLFVFILELVQSI
jgi:hypothetical protein